MVNDRARTVDLYYPDQPPRTLQGGERLDLDDLLPGFDLTPDALFALRKVR